MVPESGIGCGLGGLEVGGGLVGAEVGGVQSPEPSLFTAVSLLSPQHCASRNGREQEDVMAVVVCVQEDWG